VFYKKYPNELISFAVIIIMLICHAIWDNGMCFVNKLIQASTIKQLRTDHEITIVMWLQYFCRTTPRETNEKFWGPDVTRPW